MAPIPLEDSFTDILGKTQRGLKLSDEAVAKTAGVHADEFLRAKGGEIHEPVLRKLAAYSLKGAAYSIKGLCKTIASCLDELSRTECAAYLANSGYASA